MTNTTQTQTDGQTDRHVAREPMLFGCLVGRDSRLVWKYQVAR